MEEIYKDIEGYEGLYQVSNLGNVKSLNYHNTKKEKKLCKIKNKCGYLYVNLWKQGKQKNYFVHRLVAQAFIENPNNYSCINHKDENKQNNVVSNIEWCTYKYNCNYGTRNSRAGKSISKAMTNNPKRSKVMTNNTKISKQVCAYKNGKLVIVFPSTMEAQRQGYKSGAVSMCCRNCFNRPGNNVYKGYEWRYL